MYRRHTNFSIEPIRVPFTNGSEMGQTSTVILPKSGDLIHKMYIEIVIPEIHMKRATLPDSSDESYNLDAAKVDMRTVTDFMKINTRAYDIVIENLLPINVTDNSQMIVEVMLYYEGLGPEEKETIEKFNELMKRTTPKGVRFEHVHILNIVKNTINEDTEKSIVFTIMKNCIHLCTIVQEYFHDALKLTQALYDDVSSKYIKFAWVEKLGNYIINNVSIDLNGDVVDRHTGEWLNIWHELTRSRYTEQAYRHMIGDVAELTTFNREKKPRYTLRVPLQFWFCRYNGSALPIISLQHQDVSVSVTFRNFEECCYVEKNTLIQIDNCPDDVFLSEVLQCLGTNIEANLYIDYVFLEKSERKKFAMFAHEYLIDQLQVNEFNNVTQENFQARLNFERMCKEFVVVTQKSKYTDVSVIGDNVLRWNNYTLTDENIGNPVESASIALNGVLILDNMHGSILNYTYPYAYHTSTPADGINIVPKSLYPEEYQPSGAINTSRISNVTLYVNINPGMFEDEDGDDTSVNIRVYAINHNVFRVMKGYAACAFAC